MSPNLGFLPKNIAIASGSVLPSATVTSRQLLAASLKALLHNRGVTALHVARAIGVDNATISKFQLPNSDRWRWPRADHFDALATFFGVQPYVLLKPDEALMHRLGDRGGALPEPDSSLSRDVGVSSGASPLSQGAPDVPEAALFRKLTAYWAAMDPTRHAELVRIAWELSDPGSERPVAGFKRG